MTVTIAPLSERDFFGWYALLTEYAGERGLPLDDQAAMRVWTRLQEGGRHAVVAKDEAGDIVGLAHVSTFERLLQGDGGVQVDDLFVRLDARGHGVATALVEHVRSRAEDEGTGVLRWPMHPDDRAAKALWNRFAAASDWTLQDLTVG